MAIAVGLMIAVVVLLGAALLFYQGRQRPAMGAEYVALGSDYDGATTVRFDTGQLVQLTQALLDAGFTPDEIRAVMGGNALRVLHAGLLPYAEWAKGRRRG